jgi:large subunit ribosomal protein L5e
MGFIKIQKNKAYFKRYQVKYRRRRQNKTDYKARIAMVNQDKNKYQTPKYRFVVRITNRDVICQVFSSDIKHDICLTSAYSHELKRYGLTVGLTNYAAAYATGLLLARRVDAKYSIGYKGNMLVDGKEFHVKDDGEGMAPFRALLDVGLARTTTGARIFGALKGAADGGIDIPHNMRRFPGSIRPEEGKKWEYDAKVHRKYIFGGHVADYMRTLNESDPEAFKRQFSRFIAAGISADKVEKMYAATHAAIRRNPNVARAATERGYFLTQAAGGKKSDEHRKSANRKKMTASQRFDRIYHKLKAADKQPVAQILH